MWRRALLVGELLLYITRLPINDQVEAIDWKQHPLSGNGTRRLRGKCPISPLQAEQLQQRKY